MTRTAPAYLTIRFGRLDAVIFDLDGVITKTAEVHKAAWKRVLLEAAGLLGHFEAIVDGTDAATDAMAANPTRRCL